ncbi:hypothetical protein Cgig2_015465 [Carnegiea gigantea]|uniref:Uncharacterized protein n=1 Tax=Carnegiea gigantea TaxID=171969 RepID=A0A9Q1JP89_9CARY|nr:hypothetical protein Cgig2_015465 [Carnegiea gigantea]
MGNEPNWKKPLRCPGKVAGDKTAGGSLTVGNRASRRPPQKPHSSKNTEEKSRSVEKRGRRPMKKHWPPVSRDDGGSRRPEVQQTPVLEKFLFGTPKGLDKKENIVRQNTYKADDVSLHQGLMVLLAYRSQITYTKSARKNEATQRQSAIQNHTMVKRAWMSVPLTLLVPTKRLPDFAIEQSKWMSKSALGQGMSDEEKNIVKQELKGLAMEDISSFMESVPTDFLIILRIDGVIRSILNKLGVSRSVRLLTYAKHAVYGLSVTCDSKSGSTLLALLSIIRTKLSYLQFKCILGVLGLISWMDDVKHLSGKSLRALLAAAPRLVLDQLWSLTFAENWQSFTGAYWCSQLEFSIGKFTRPTGRTRLQGEIGSEEEGRAKKRVVAEVEEGSAASGPSQRKTRRAVEEEAMEEQPNTTHTSVGGSWEGEYCTCPKLTF